MVPKTAHLAVRAADYPQAHSKTEYCHQLADVLYNKTNSTLLTARSCSGNVAAYEQPIKKNLLWHSSTQKGVLCSDGKLQTLTVAPQAKIVCTMWKVSVISSNILTITFSAEDKILKVSLFFVHKPAI